MCICAKMSIQVANHKPTVLCKIASVYASRQVDRWNRAFSFLQVLTLSCVVRGTLRAYKLHRTISEERRRTLQ